MANPFWFEREFDFSLPVEQLGHVLDRLRKTPERLTTMVQKVPEGVLKRKHDDGWSAQEHAGHLLDLEPLWLARVGAYTMGREELQAADLTNRRTHEANHNARPIAQILEAFGRHRGILVDAVRQVDPALYTRAIPHPRLKKPMRLIDHLYFVAEHDEHHLTAVRKLTEAFPAA